MMSTNINQVYGKELLNFYKKLFEGTGSSYGFISPTHVFCPIPDKELVLPYPFLKIINTKPMQKAGEKIQTSHCYKIHPRMDISRLDHMILAESLGVDLLSILEKKGYPIDNYTKIAFLVFLLTHDIGHGPFSHPFEQMVEGYKGMHEDIGKRALLEEEELHNVLEEIYPGLTERVIHFKEHDTYGLSSLLEGVFDLDRASFLIADTYLMDGDTKYESYLSITNCVYQIMNRIILKEGKVYFEKSAFPYIDTFLRIRKENYEGEYKYATSVLDDLLLKRIGDRTIELACTSKVFSYLPPTIQTEISRFASFIAHMKEQKKDISISEYYSFGDPFFERIFRFLLLVEDSRLREDALLMISPISIYDAYYDIRKNEKETGEEDFYVVNQFTIYKSKPDENITFLEGSQKIDYQDCEGKFTRDSVFQETLSYFPKKPHSLTCEKELRETLIQKLNQALVEKESELKGLTCISLAEKVILSEVKRYCYCVKKNISLEEYTTLYGLSSNRIFAYLAMMNLEEASRIARMLLSRSLGYFYTEEEARREISQENKIYSKKDVI